mmetsp:Transcript_29457/g.63602  ORF Transcript_29457/g.63602 Transcript_29457/m.63602 type:complete len:261 (-) Transcript_29457:13-795(-)
MLSAPVPSTAASTPAVAARVRVVGASLRRRWCAWRTGRRSEWTSSLLATRLRRCPPMVVCPRRPSSSSATRTRPSPRHSPASSSRRSSSVSPTTTSCRPRAPGCGAMPSRREVVPSTSTTLSGCTVMAVSRRHASCPPLRNGARASSTPTSSMTTCSSSTASSPRRIRRGFWMAFCRRSLLPGSRKSMASRSHPLGGFTGSWAPLGQRWYKTNCLLRTRGASKGSGLVSSHTSPSSQTRAPTSRPLSSLIFAARCRNVAF